MKTKEFIVKITIEDNGQTHYEIRDYQDQQSEFIPPLQTELEMLKYRSGIDSAYDEENPDGNTCTRFLDQPEQTSRW